MPARKPEEVDLEFAVALNAGNIDALTALYEPDASLTPQPGVTVKGAAAIRQALQAFVDANPHIAISPRVVSQVDDIALVSAQYELSLTGPDGKRAQITGRSVEILRRQADGTWKFLIDEPFGVGA
ncbi:MAG TPA: SgcJ/EcaC family oxidoreductase [Casimicrobiaceae bacterium]|nr:SgcJ/EcaC family oxidoreductase [Casimicrobiaceae bacterium]